MKRIVAIALAVLILLSLVLPLVSSAEELTDPTETTGATEVSVVSESTAATEASEPPESTAATEVIETTEATQAPTEPVLTNTCGEGLTWTYEKGVLTVSGSGKMEDYEDGGAPWNRYREEITAVVFTGGVTYVGTNAFRDYDSLLAVDFGDAMHTIGERAFQSCGGLTSIHMPASFKRFSKSCFEGCVDLKEVYCAGGMPSFNMNCLWNYSNITVYCPTNKPWNASLVRELEEGFGGRLQVLTEDGADIYDFAPEETEETTVATTEAATEPTAEPTTEPTTEAATEPTTAPSTEATEVTETTAAPAQEETLPAETVEQTQPEEKSYLAGKSWIALVIIAGILTALLAGALIVRRSGRGGKYVR